MIEILSNFFIKNKKDPEIPSNLNKTYNINLDDIDEKLPLIIDDYKNFKTILVIYSENEDAKYFLSILTKRYCNVKHRSEFEDLLLMNGCLFL